VVGCEVEVFMANFPTQEPIYCRYRINEKGKKKKEKIAIQGNTGPFPPLGSRIDCSTAGGIGKVAAALAKEIVTADVSLGGNLGARGSSRGGGWENEEREL